MKAKLIDDRAQKTFPIVFDKGDEFINELTSFAKKNDLGASHFTAIGAFRDVMLGYFDRDKKKYQEIPVVEQVEVLSLVGDIALTGDTPQVHAHVVLGKADGTVLGMLLAIPVAACVKIFFEEVVLPPFRRWAASH